MATSLGTDGDILQHIQAHMPLSNAIHGEEAMEGNAAVETPPVICFWHHQGDRRRSRDARGGHSSKRRQRPTTIASLTQEGSTITWERGREQTKRIQGGGISLHSGTLKRVNGVDDVATIGSRKLELGFHQEGRHKTTVIELGAYNIDASKEVIGARVRHRRLHRHGCARLSPKLP